MPDGTLLHRAASCGSTAARHDRSFPRLAHARRLFAGMVGGGKRDGRQGAGDGDGAHGGDDRQRRAEARKWCQEMRQCTTTSNRWSSCRSIPRGVAALAGDAAAAAWDTAWQAATAAFSYTSATTRALLPMPNVQVYSPPEDGTFRWIVRPADSIVEATFFTDASCIDEYDPDTMRLGWAFTALDSEGRCVAAAHGVPPPWITDNSGAEAWAPLEAVESAHPAATFRTDSLVTLDALRKGKTWAIGPKRPLARVWRMLHVAMDSDEAISRVVWLPSHRCSADVGRAVLSDGSLLTEFDREGNNKADLLAKAAAKAVRAPLAERLAVVTTECAATWAATMIGRLTWAANHGDGQPPRDSAPVRRTRRGDELPPGEAVRLPRRRAPPQPRPPQLGGHVVAERSGGAVACGVCRKFSAARATFLAQRCPGMAALRWAQREQADEHGQRGGASTHLRCLTDGIVWCMRCASYSAERAVGLTRQCRGQLVKGVDWGRHTSLARLRKFRHPKTNAALRPPHYPEVAAMTLGQEVVLPWVPRGARGQLGGARPSDAMEVDAADDDHRAARLPPRRRSHDTPLQRDGDPLAPPLPVNRPRAHDPPPASRSAQEAGDDYGFEGARARAGPMCDVPYADAVEVNASCSSTPAPGTPSCSTLSPARRMELLRQRIRTRINSVGSATPPAIPGQAETRQGSAPVATTDANRLDRAGVAHVDRATAASPLLVACGVPPAGDGGGGGPPPAIRRRITAKSFVPVPRDGRVQRLQGGVQLHRAPETLCRQAVIESTVQPSASACHHLWPHPHAGGNCESGGQDSSHHAGRGG